MFAAAQYATMDWLVLLIQVACRTDIHHHLGTGPMPYAGVYAYIICGQEQTHPNKRYIFIHKIANARTSLLIVEMFQGTDIILGDMTELTILQSLQIYVQHFQIYF